MSSDRIRWPGGPRIRSHRLLRRRTPALLLAATVVLTAGASATPASARVGHGQTPEQVSATTTTAPTAPNPPPTAPTPPPPVASTAGPGVYGVPQWLPLRRNLSGTEITVGCTYDSHGSSHGYECAGHHARWALDFIAETGSPVFAAGAGFATNLTGKPGGGGFGNVVRIDHGFGISTLYAHLTTVLVPAEGRWVDETTQVGTVGATGSASTAHLHFERFGLPAPGAPAGSQVSTDPGQLFACRGPYLVSFPQVAGFASWKNLPWGSLTVASDGHDCLPAVDEATPARPVRVPDTPSVADVVDQLVEAALKSI